MIEPLDLMKFYLRRPSTLDQWHCAGCRTCSTRLETITRCRHTEAWKGPIKPEKLQTNLATLPHLIYKLYGRLIMNRLSLSLNVPHSEQAGFCPLVDHSAPYDTVNHWRLLKKGLRHDNGPPFSIQGLHSAGEPPLLRWTWRETEQTAPARERTTSGKLLVPLLFNVYTNDQPIHPNTRSFVYANDLATTAQDTQCCQYVCASDGVLWN